MSPTFAQLASKYARGFRNIDTDDFEGMAVNDRLRLMEDVNGSSIVYFDIDDCVVRAKHDPEEDAKKKKKGSKGRLALPPRTFRYTMSTQNPVGPFGDVVIVKGWDLKDFKTRGQPFLFGHNIDQNRHPLGKMSGLLKGAEEDFVRGQPVLAGNATFSDEGISAFNDLTHDMVRAGFMPGSSVGFDIVKARQPTDEEMAQDSRLKKWSFIAEKSRLVEFSSTPVGMDPDAVKRRSIDGQDSPLERALLTAVQEGRYDAELVAEFRERAMGESGPRGRSHVSMADRISAADGVPKEGYTATEGRTYQIDDDGVRDVTDNYPSDDLDGIARLLAGEDTEQGAGSLDTDTTNDNTGAPQQRSDSISGDPEAESAPSPIGLTIEDSLRALDALGFQDCREDFLAAVRAVTKAPDAEPVDLGLNAPVTLAEFREENQSLRALTERLEERIAHLEDALLPESAESGAATGSRNDAGDDGDSYGVDLYADLFVGSES